MAEFWGFFGLPLNGTTDCKDPVWTFATGWSLYLLALLVAVLVIGYVIYDQSEYELLSKILSSIKADMTWGPRDPIVNFKWKNEVEQRGMFSKKNSGQDHQTNRRHSVLIAPIAGRRRFLPQ